LPRRPGARYPSDHRRWFRVYEDILDDTKLGSLKKADRWVFIALLAMLNRTKCASGNLDLTPAGMMSVTETHSHRDAYAVLSRLEGAGLATLTPWPRGIEVWIRNWSTLQGLAPTKPRLLHPTPTPKTTPTVGTKTPAPKRRSPAPPAAWALTLASELSEAVRRRWPGALVPSSLVAWARDLERCPGEEATADLLRWYAAPERDGQPYLPEARAARSFREKWNQIVAARQRTNGSAVTAHGNGVQSPIARKAQERADHLESVARGALELMRREREGRA